MCIYTRPTDRIGPVTIYQLVSSLFRSCLQALIGSSKCDGAPRFFSLFLLPRGITPKSHPSPCPVARSEYSHSRSSPPPLRDGALSWLARSLSERTIGISSTSTRATSSVERETFVSLFEWVAGLSSRTSSVPPGRPLHVDWDAAAGCGIAIQSRRWCSAIPQMKKLTILMLLLVRSANPSSLPLLRPCTAGSHSAARLRDRRRMHLHLRPRCSSERQCQLLRTPALSTTAAAHSISTLWRTHA